MTAESKPVAADWQRPPFEPGNQMAVKHGAYSSRVTAPRANEIMAELLADPALPVYLRNDLSYRPAIASLCRAEAVVEVLEQYVLTQPVEKATKGALPVLEQLRRWMATAQSHRRALGLDPMSRAGLTKDLAVARSAAADVVREQAAEGAQALAARSGGAQ